MFGIEIKIKINEKIGFFGAVKTIGIIYY